MKLATKKATDNIERLRVPSQRLLVATVIDWQVADRQVACLAGSCPAREAGKTERG